MICFIECCKMFRINIMCDSFSHNIPVDFGFYRSFEFKRQFESLVYRDWQRNEECIRFYEFFKFSITNERKTV